MIDIYNDSQGKHVQVYCILEEGKYRILYILDSEKVLLLDKDGNLQIEEYNLVNESQKVFYYREEATKLTEYELTDGETYCGETTVSIYI